MAHERGIPAAEHLAILELQDSRAQVVGAVT